MSYELNIGSTPVSQYWAAIELIIEKHIEKNFLKYLPQMESYINSVSKNEDLMGTNEVCKKLGISRQTLYNWFKNPSTKFLLHGTFEKMGGKNKYRLHQIKKVLEANDSIFTKV